MGQEWKENMGKAAVILVCVLISALLMVQLQKSVGNPGSPAQTAVQDAAILDKFDMFMNNTISDSLSGLLSIEKVYWLNDGDLVAPEPEQANFGEAATPAQLEEVLKGGEKLIHGDAMYFDPQSTVLKPGTDVFYYRDETILAITWQELHGNCVYTFSEVFIAHPSQFRRFLAGGEYGSEKQYTTTEMAASVNAVVASSGDFYRFREFGTIVYDGVVQRINSKHVDTCFVDDAGDLHFTYGGEITEQEEAQRFVDENNIRFSVAFGPVLVDGGEVAVPDQYILGEVWDRYPRAALCQMGQLHYLLAVANLEYPNHQVTPDILMFAKRIHATGCQKAYALDGGQTAVIAMNDTLMNRVHFGYQRKISDIIYFATAVPDGG